MKTIMIDGIEYDLVSKAKEEKVYSGWRLPTIHELLSLVDYNTHTPKSYDKSIKGDYYWSSTTDASDSDDAWYINFNDGYSGNCNKSNGSYVRFCRDGTNGLEWSETLPGVMTWHEAIELAETYQGKVTFRSEK